MLEAASLFRRKQGGGRNNIQIKTYPPSGLEFVLVPGGTYLMGSARNEKGRNDEACNYLGFRPAMSLSSM